MRPVPMFYSVAAVLMTINALLHIFALVPGGFTTSALQLVPVGFGYLLLAFGLYRNMRWVAWIQFFVALIGGLAAFIMMPNSTVPAVWLWAIIVLDVAVLCLMLLILWPARARKTA